MGDGGWRRIDAAAARHILTRVGLSVKGRRFIGAFCAVRQGGEQWEPLGRIRKGGASSAPPFPLTNPICLGGVSAARSRSPRQDIPLP